MRKYAVKDNSDALLLCGLTKMHKILLCTQQRVDLRVVRGAVAVVFMRFKDRVQVYDIAAQPRDIVKLFLDALQITAEIVVIGNISVAVRLPVRHVVPVRVYLAVIRHIVVGLCAFREPVGEYLIHHAALEPLGSGHSLLVNGELEQVAVVDNTFACAVFLDVVTVSVDKQREVVVMQPEVVRRVDADIICVPVGGITLFELNEALLEAGSEHNQHRLLNSRIFGEF